MCHERMPAALSNIAAQRATRNRQCLTLDFILPAVTLSIVEEGLAELCSWRATRELRPGVPRKNYLQLIVLNKLHSQANHRGKLSIFTSLMLE